MVLFSSENIWVCVRFFGFVLVFDQVFLFKRMHKRLVLNTKWYIPTHLFWNE